MKSTAALVLIGSLLARLAILMRRHDLPASRAARRLSVEFAIYVPATVLSLVMLVGVLLLIDLLGFSARLLGVTAPGAATVPIVFGMVLLLLLPAVPPLLYAVAVIAAWPARVLRRRGVVDRLAGTRIDQR